MNTYLAQIVALTPIIETIANRPTSHSDTVQRIKARRTQCLTTAQNLTNLMRITNPECTAELAVAVQAIMDHHDSLPAPNHSHQSAA